MKESWIRFWRRVDLIPSAPAPIAEEPGISIEQGIEDYFAATDDREVLTTYHRCRAILVGRKLLKKERSDKGTKRVGKLGMASDVRGGR